VVRLFPAAALIALRCGLGCDAGADKPPPPHAGAPVIAEGEPGVDRGAEQPDAIALAELLDAVPSGTVAATAPDGGTLVGSDTGVDGDEMPWAPPAPSRSRLRPGPMRVQPLLSNGAIERAARAQIYWPLRECLDADGQLPPAESITLAFSLRPDGSVDPATVSASASEKRLEPVAECVVRRFSAGAFRGPAAARGTSARVVILWPSVD
jgi:hypothetical protein